MSKEQSPSLSAEEQPPEPDTPTLASGWQGPPIVRPFDIGPPERGDGGNAQPSLKAQIPPAWREAKSWGIAGAVVVCLLLLFYVVRPPAAPAPRPASPDTRTFFLGGILGGAPTLIFAHSIGNVHIHSGADGQVSIREDRNGYPDAIHISYDQAGATIHITSDIDSDLASDTWVDFDVSVPRLMGLSAALLNGGTLEATNLNGPITLSNTNGSIWATNDTGSLTAQTQSGSINVSQFSGQMKLTTQNGTITTGDVHVSGHSLLQAQTGTINFHGALERSASALFTDTNGQVSLNLPGHSAFHVRVQTGGGAVNSEFPGITIRPRPPGIEADGDVGTPPRAQLTIQTTTGPVLLNQEG
jgi:hypothetical protein